MRWEMRCVYIVCYAMLCCIVLCAKPYQKPTYSTHILRIIHIIICDLCWNFSDKIEIFHSVFVLSSLPLSSSPYFSIENRRKIVRQKKVTMNKIWKRKSMSIWIALKSHSNACSTRSSKKLQKLQVYLKKYNFWRQISKFRVEIKELEQSYYSRLWHTFILFINSILMLFTLICSAIHNIRYPNKAISYRSKI